MNFITIPGGLTINLANIENVLVYEDGTSRVWFASGREWSLGKNQTIALLAAIEK